MEICTKITRGTKELIKLAIESCSPENKNNRYEICFQMTNIMLDRYKDDNFDYQARRMNMDSTKKILDKIDIYFYKYQKLN